MGQWWVVWATLNKVCSVAALWGLMRTRHVGERGLDEYEKKLRCEHGWEDGCMYESIHPFAPSSVVARCREELIACGYGGKEMKWWPLCRLWSDSIVVAATAVAMATIQMAMSCPTLSSSSSAFQVLTSYPALQFPLKPGDVRFSVNLLAPR